MEKTADREARRAIAGTGAAVSRAHIPEERHPDIDELADTYVKDGAALEVLRLTEIATVYRAYQEELARRGALDFGEQIAAVTQLFKVRPNLLRRWQRQFAHILVDEFQDVNIAQIELVELLGRTPDRPDNVMVVGDDNQSIYRFRGASFAAFSEFDRRFSRPPAHDRDGPAPGPPPRFRIEENFRSVEHILTAANRLIGRSDALRAGQAAPNRARRGGAGRPRHLRRPRGRGGGHRGRHPRSARRAPRWSDAAVLYRKHKHREAIVARLREEDIPCTVVGGLSLFATPEIRDLEQALRAIADPHDDVALTRMMTAGPWRLDALEILDITRTARLTAAIWLTPSTRWSSAPRAPMAPMAPSPPMAPIPPDTQSSHFPRDPGEAPASARRHPRRSGGGTFTFERTALLRPPRIARHHITSAWRAPPSIQ